MSTGVSMPLARNVPMIDSPSSFGSMRSTISTSYWPVERKRQAFFAVAGVVGDMTDLAKGLDEIIRRHRGRPR